MNEKTFEQSGNETVLSASVKEGKICAGDFLSEIQLLLKDYFVGTVEESDGVLSFRFLNGQKFRISVEEII